MDQVSIAEQPTPAERAAVDAELGAPESHWHGGERAAVGASVASASSAGADMRTSRSSWQWASAQRHLLLPVLWAVQDAIGHVTAGALGYLCQRLGVPPAEAYGVATFYALLGTTPAPPTVAHVCDDIACQTQGAEQLCQALAAQHAAGGEGSGATWHRSPCLGQCERGPAVLLQRAGAANTVLTGADVAAVMRALDGVDPASAPPPLPPPAAVRRRGELLRRVGKVAHDDLDAYRAGGGYVALQRAIDLGAAAVCREVAAARLLGRGGAAFPTGRKWQAVADAVLQPHYVVCNADESEPGTFKDRVVLEEDPFAVVEALTIAGLATGAERGFLYIRGEYPVAIERMQASIAQCRQQALLGEAILGSRHRFDIELRRGAGAYICGEETALFNSIEGFRGEPRNKPPYPSEVGLFGKPTAVNNVETLINVLPILLLGSAEYAATGTEASTGSKLLCVSGSVGRPGLYEVEFGVTLGELLDLAGGVRPGAKLRAVLLGGAAGSFVGVDQLEMPLTFEGCREAGTSLGSGVVMAFDQDVDMPRIVTRIAQFFRDESCGQCVPCRVGTVRVVEALQRLRGAEHAAEIELIDDVAQAMRDASICGLGHTAANAVQSALSMGLLQQ